MTMDYTGYLNELDASLRAIPIERLEAVRKALTACFEAGRTVYVAGNGGSAATASHLACDLQKTTLAKEHDRVAKRIRCIALTDNVPLMTAWGNDVGYDEIFGQQLRNLASPGDTLLVITASGNSSNILSALRAARELRLETIGFLGFDGGKALDECDLSVVVESRNYGVVEDAHSVLMHMLTGALKPIVLAP